MKVILTEKVKTLGNVGEIVNVSEGYARNFLIPQNVAVLADDKNKAILENEQKRLATKIAGEKKAAEEVAGKIKGQTITFTKKVGGNGKIFGTVTNAEIAAEFAKTGVEVEKRVFVVTNPIKTLGSFEVKAKLFKDVEVDFNVKVEMDPAQVEEIKKKQAAAAKKASKKEEAKAEEATAETATEETTEA